MQEQPYPLLLAPVYKDYIWGGSRIPELFDRTGTSSPCAESWEVSCHPDGTTCVENGPCSGTPLSTLWNAWGEAISGEQGASDFPLLIKLIDAKDDLSVQVHPNNGNAHLFNGEPKTEMWYVLDAQPGATIYAGLRPGVTRDDFLAALEATQLEEVLNCIPAEPGTAIFMPGGCVHAIGKGCLILETQQSSNTTYRAYDWGRVGTDGIPRPTHRKEALGVIDWESPTNTPRQGEITEETAHMTAATMVTCEFFTTNKLTLRGEATRTGDGSRFRAYFAVDTDVQLSTPAGDLLLPRGRTALIPAAITNLVLAPASDGATLIEMTP
jgi:mannose-6-phosphate isomerase